MIMQYYGKIRGIELSEGLLAIVFILVVCWWVMKSEHD